MSNKTTRQLIAARLGLLSGGIDNKRPRAWDEYGFKEKLEFDDFYKAFKRIEIANGAVNHLIDRCWSSAPILIEGDEAENATNYTTKETAWRKMFKDLKLWKNFKEADKRRLVGRYSGLVMYFADGKDWDKPVVGTPRLVKIAPVWANQLKVKEVYTDRSNFETFGTPKTYDFKQGKIGDDAASTVTIHADRVFILGSMDEMDEAFLEAGYNQLVNIEKITGGSGESVLKNAAQNVVIEYDKDIDLSEMAQSMGVDMEGLQEFMDARARDWGSGVDKMMALQGGKANMLQAPTLDPSGAFNVSISAFAASVRIPTKILIGNQQAERASSEDIKQFNARCQSRRVSELSDEIGLFMEHLNRIGLIDLGDEYTVIWDDLTRPTLADRLSDAKAMADISVTGISSGEPYFTDAEIREVVGYDPAKS